MKKRFLKIIAVVMCLVLAVPATACTKKLAYSGKALAAGRAGAPYDARVDDATGADSITYELKEGTELPLGLVLSLAGVISGKTESVGSYTFKVVASAKGCKSAEAEFTLTIAAKLNLTYNPEGGVKALKSGVARTAYTPVSVATAKGANGTTEGITYALKTGYVLPDGLDLSPSGEISGTPTMAWESKNNFCVVASAAGYKDAEAYFSIEVSWPNISFTSSSLAKGIAGESYNASVGTGIEGISYMILNKEVNGDLPKGLTINESTGQITGKPEAYSGTFNFTVRASADGYNSTDAKFSIEITVRVVSYNPEASGGETILPSGKIAMDYTGTVATATALGDPVISYALADGSLPEGLKLEAGGTLSGKPEELGNFEFTVTASADYYTSADAKFSMAVTDLGGITINTEPLPDGKIGELYSQTIVATAPGNPAIAYEIADGTSQLDNLNLALNSDGTITGTPMKTGTANFTVRAYATNYTSATAPFSITITNLGTITITTTTLPGGSVGTAYSQTIQATASSGTPTITYALASGSSLPLGLSLNTATGAISGTISDSALAQIYSFTVSASADNYAGDSKAFTIEVSPILRYNGRTLTAATIGQAYTASVAYATALGVSVQPAITYALMSGSSLPAGLSLNPSTGAVTGTVDTTETVRTCTFTIIASTSGYYSVSAVFTINITNVDAVTITTPSPLVNGKIGDAYSATVAATAPGNPTISFTVTGGNLPDGLGLNASTGVISGIPTKDGPFKFTVKADATGFYADEVEFSITITNLGSLTITTTSPLSDGKIGEAYSQTIVATASYGTPVITYAITAGSLPNGLSINASTGVISGTPSEIVTNRTFTVTATAANYDSASKQFSITITNLGTITITTTSLPGGSVGTAYSQTIVATASYGTPVITYAITAGSLPNGLSINASTGVISGTPTQTGTFTFTVRASADNYTSGFMELSITIAAGSITYSYTPQPYTLPGGMLGTPYSVSVGTATASGNPTITYTVTVGSLPNGLSLNASTGLISGMPTQTGTFTFTVRASATGYNNASVQFIIIVTYQGTITFITSASLPDGIKDESYSEFIVATASSGSPAITYAITSGSLPNGLSLNTSTGAITGTPAAVNTFSFEVTASAQYYQAAVRTFTINIKIDTGSGAVPYIFEAEHVDLTDKEGVVYSSSCYEEELIVVDSPTTADENGKIGKDGPPKREQSPSNGLSAGQMYESEIFIEFVIWSDKAVSNAKLEARLSAQYHDVYIAPLPTYTGGKEYYSFTFGVNVEGGVPAILAAAMPTVGAPKLLPGMLNYAPIALEGAAAPMDIPLRPFTDHLISMDVSLKAGPNSIVLVVTNSEFWESTIAAMAPQIDWIKITTDANLRWHVPDYNPRWAADGFAYDSLVTNWIEVRKAFNEGNLGDRE